MTLLMPDGAMEDTLGGACKSGSRQAAQRLVRYHSTWREGSPSVSAKPLLHTALLRGPLASYELQAYK